MRDVMFRSSTAICLLVLTSYVGSCSRAPNTPPTSNWSIAPALLHEVAGVDITDCFLDERGITILTRDPGRGVNTLLRLNHGEQTPSVLATFTGGVAELVSPVAVAFPRDESMWLIAPPYTKEIEVTRYESTSLVIEGFGDHCLAICRAETTPGNYTLEALVIENASGQIVAREPLDSSTPRAAALTSDAAIAYGRKPEWGEHDITFQRDPDGGFNAVRREVDATLVGSVRVAVRSDGVPITSPPTHHGFRLKEVRIEGSILRLPEQLLIGREWTMHEDILIYPGERSLILVDTQSKQLTRIPTLGVYPSDTKIGLGRSELPDRLPIWGRQQIRMIERAP